MAAQLPEYIQNQFCSLNGWIEWFENYISISVKVLF